MMHPHEITILGTGFVGWLTAAALARSQAGHGSSITLVPVPGPDDSLDPFGPGTILMPGGLEAMAALIGANPADILREGGGGFSLGTAFQGWTSPDTSHFLPFGDTGADLNGVGFQHLVWRARAAGISVRMTDYALAALAAQAERFALPSPDPRSVLSTLTPGAFVDLRRLTALARRQAQQAGVRLSPAPLAQVQRRADGTVSGLVLADEHVVGGDWFLDTSGPRALLAAADNEWVDWRPWLPADRCSVERVATDGAPPPYALHRAEPDGWSRHLPLRGEAWVTRLGGQGPIACRSGHRARPWEGNVTALGAAAGLVDPVGGGGLALTLTALQRLITHYPVQPGQGREAASFNRQTVEEMERVRDFSTLCFTLNGRQGDAFWEAARRIDLPHELAHKLALYESRGRIPLYDGELFERADWMNLLDARGVRAQRCDILANALSDAAILAHLERMRSVLLRAVAAMPPHGRALAELLGAAA